MHEVIFYLWNGLLGILVFGIIILCVAGGNSTIPTSLAAAEAARRMRRLREEKESATSMRKLNEELLSPYEIAGSMFFAEGKYFKSTTLLLDYLGENKAITEISSWNGGKVFECSITDATTVRDGQMPKKYPASYPFRQSDAALPAFTRRCCNCGNCGYQPLKVMGDIAPPPKKP